MLSSRFLFELVEAQEVIIAANTAVANMCFFITKSIDYLLVLRLWSGYHGALYQFPPLCSSVEGILLSVSCIAIVGCNVPSCSQGVDSMPAPM